MPATRGTPLTIDPVPCGARTLPFMLSVCLGDEARGIGSGERVSADRWWSVHKPFNYRVKQSKSTATTFLTATWVLTFLLHLPLTGLYDVIAALVTSSPARAEDSLGQWLEEEGGGEGLVKCGSGGVGRDLTLCGETFDERVSSSPVVRVFRHCEVPYRDDVVFVVMLTTLRYLAPFLFLLVLNLTLYSKISDRKRMQVRRSISGIDTVLFSLLKASASDTECNNEDNNNDLIRAQRIERRLSRLSPAPLNRRHTMSQILFPGVNNNSSPTATATCQTQAPSPRQSRPLRRRISLQDCLQNSGYSSSLQVPRRKSHGLTQSLSDSLLPVSRRASREDLAKDMLLKQDKRAACFLGLLQEGF
ncbi:hypothetical protein ACOMHN_040795 [Nucella lapillus]